MRQQNWQQAIISLDDYIQKYPRDGVAHLLLAEVYGESDSIMAMQSTLYKLRTFSPNMKTL